MKQTDNTRSVTHIHTRPAYPHLQVVTAKLSLPQLMHKSGRTLPVMPPALDYLNFAINSSTTRSCFHCCHQSRSSPHMLFYYVMLLIYGRPM